MKKAVLILVSILLVLCIGSGAAVLIDLPRTNRQEAQLLEEAKQAEGSGPFYPGDATGALYNRIPALITTKDGTLVAAADARFGGTQDSPNNLDTAVSTSSDAGKTWSAPTLPNHLVDYADFDTPLKHSAKISFARKQSASYIDPALVEDESNGRIFMLTDLFPAGGGAWQSKAGSGYTEVNGKKYLKLRKKGSRNYNYTVRENNVIYNAKGEPTEYSLNPQMEVLKNGEPLLVRQRDVWSRFNLLLTKPGSQKVAMNIMYADSLFQPLRTSYLCLKYSDDQGKTWSEPQILNAMVKSEDMTFLGVGPGRGTQIQSGNYKGRLLFPVYQLNTETGGQNCHVIYSDDHGATWSLSKSPRFDEAVVKSMSESAVVELPDGSLRLFARTNADHIAMSASTDGGATWSEGKLVDALSTGGSSCQISAIHYQGLIDGSPAVLLSTPAANGRKNGVIHVGLVKEAAGSFEIQWDYQYEVTGKDEAFLYSCLTQLPSGEIGLLYEKENGPQPFHMLHYRQFSIKELLGGK